MSNIDGLDTISNDELASLHERVNKEVKRRSGSDIDIKKLRIQVYKLAKSLGCEWVPESLPGESLAEDALPKRRGRKPKIDVSAQTAALAANETKVDGAALPAGRQATAPISSSPIEDEKRKLWPI